MRYVTFQEGFLDKVKDRVQTNAGHVAGAVNRIITGARDVGQGIARTADKAGEKVNSLAKAVGAKGFAGNPTSAGQKLMQTSMIKRQIPNSPTNTTDSLL